MFNASQYSFQTSQAHDHDTRRMSLPPAGHTAHSPFTSSVTGSSSHHGPNTWAASTSGAMPGSLTDPFSQSRTNYQQGFIMSMSQNNAAPSTSPRFEELPVVQTKAKMNSSLARSSTIEFGKDPMFESSLRRQTLDEDAPPTTSINDMVGATFPDSQSTSFSRSQNNSMGQSLFSSSSRPQHNVPTTGELLYVIVFGYPSDKYSVAVEYFKQLGDSCDPEPSAEVLNAFRIGYKQPVDAIRAVRKNGELINGCWMVGAKWEDPSRAEFLLGQPISRHFPQSTDMGPSNGTSVRPPQEVDALTVAIPRTSMSSARATPSVGTPIRLAPSTSAFKRPGSIPNQPSAVDMKAPLDGTKNTSSAQSKGVLGQLTDMVFGW